MRTLVTGGTGFIGRALVAALRARGDEVVVISRRGEGGAVAWDCIAAPLENADAVFHLAGEPVAAARWTPSRVASIRSSRLETTTTLACAIERSPRKPRVLVSGSAIGIYGMQGGNAPAMSEDGPLGDDVLARITREWEAAAEPARAAGVRVVHPRTGVVLGRGGGALAKMATPFRLFAGGPIGTGDQWTSWIHLRDEVRALLFLADTEVLSGPVNLTAPEPVTMNVLAQALGHAMHRPALFRVPAVALRLALGEGLARVLLSGQRVLPRKLLAAGFKFDFPTIDDALDELF